MWVLVVVCAAGIAEAQSIRQTKAILGERKVRQRAEDAVFGGISSRLAARRGGSGSVVVAHQPISAGNPATTSLFATPEETRSDRTRTLTGSPPQRLSAALGQ